MALRTYPIDRERGRLPNSLFDPKWRDPSVAARVALEVLRQRPPERRSAPGLLRDAEALPKLKSAASVRHRAGLPPAALCPELGTWVRGLAHNELHLRHSWGGARPTRNFHAQVVTFVFDGEGRWLLRAFVGRFGSDASRDRAILVALLGGDPALGGAVIEAELQDQDQEVYAEGQDPRLIALQERPISLALQFAVQTTEDAAEDLNPGLDEALELFNP